METVEELQAKMNREPTAEEKEEIKKNVKVFENLSRNISIKDGWRFLKNLRKEARRQKSMKAAAQFEEQARDIQDVPDTPQHAFERQLADSFEIYEE